MSDAGGRRPHAFEAVTIGEEFGPREIVVDEARVKSYAFAQDDYDRWHFESSPFGGPVAHPSLLANELVQLYFEDFAIDVHGSSGGAAEAWLEEAHVEETLWFKAPLPVGETASLRGRFVDKYVSNGRGAVVLEGEARREDGRTVLSHRAIEYFRMEGPRSDDGRREPPLRRVEPGSGERRIPTLVKTITFPQLLVYSTLEHPQARRSIHTDFEIASRAGLSAPLVQGQQLACHIAEAMTRFFGASWYETGFLRTKFLGPVIAGETVEIDAVVRERRDQGTEGRRELDAWVTRRGQTVAVANASAAI